MGFQVPALIVAPEDALEFHWPLLAAGWGLDPSAAKTWGSGNAALFLPPPLAPIGYARPPGGMAAADFLPSGEAFVAQTLSRRGTAWLAGASEVAGASWAARFEGGALVAADFTTADQGRVTWGADGVNHDAQWTGDPLTAANEALTNSPAAADLESLLSELGEGPTPPKRKGFKRTCAGCGQRVDAARRRCPSCKTRIGRARRFR